MSFPTTSILDAFNRADENPLANGTWSGPIISGDDQCRLVSNQVQGFAVAAHLSESYWSAASFGPDSECFIDLITRPATAGDKAGIALRFVNPNTASANGYWALVRFDSGGGDLVRVSRIDSGAATQLGADITVSPNLASGDGFGMDMVGSTITVYTRVGGVWSSLASRTDATYTAAGRIGLRIEANDWVGDNFGGGTILGAAGDTAFVGPVFRSRMREW